MDFILEGRWYYNLKRRVLKGKSGNGLSANYVAAGGDLQYHDKYYRQTRSFSLDNIYPKFYITTGWQQIFGKHLYFDFSVGIEYNLATKYESDGFYPRFSLAVGYRF